MQVAVGHRMIEGRRPALLDSLFQVLQHLVAPHTAKCHKQLYQSDRLPEYLFSCSARPELELQPIIVVPSPDAEHLPGSQAGSDLSLFSWTFTADMQPACRAWSWRPCLHGWRASLPWATGPSCRSRCRPGCKPTRVPWTGPRAPVSSLSCRGSKLCTQPGSDHACLLVFSLLSRHPSTVAEPSTSLFGFI